MIRKAEVPYLYCPEGRVVRYQLGVTQAGGSGTGELMTCFVLVFKSHDKQRISMLHANRFTTFDEIKAEMAWVGENADYTAYGNPNTSVLHPKTTKVVSLMSLLFAEDKAGLQKRFKHVALTKDQAYVSVSAAK